MPKGSPELTNARKEEIINACEELYKTMSFKDITIKEIGNATSFTRTAIYNYFQTKEEIFLALLQREYELWIAELSQIMEENTTLTKDEFADKLARSLENRGQLLKIMSMNHYDMESSCRPERLTEFKVAYGESL
ncbi:MAG: TetR/AcrR family transcriptional regulator, partial [Lachnospiraceae bacterium]|nr:TetR/AcrR family transcriptional regulator [Lachnospiraceae bacterium]